MRSLTILTSLAALAVAACIPVPWTEPGSPALTGRIRGPDGRPAAGLRVGISGDIGDACRHPAAETTTDIHGDFLLPSTELEHRFFILLPIEKFTQPYRICGGADTSVLTAAYDGFMPAYRSGATDSVTCFSWPWHSGTRVTCTSLTQKKDIYGHESELVVRGGYWPDSVAGGYGSYRAISTHTGPWVVHPQLFLQWMRDSSVLNTIELTPLTTMTALVDPRFTFERGRWSLAVTGYQGSDVVRTLLFDLGPPDRVRLVTR